MATRTPEEEAEHEANRVAYEAARRLQHPSFRRAIIEDLDVTNDRRGEPHERTSTFDTVREMVRLSLVSDAYFAQVCYRARVSLRRRRVPVLPQLLHRLAIMTGQVSIGDPVLVGSGVYLAHGQVVIDGMVDIGSGTSISPWVTVGLISGHFKGPTIGRNVRIGTGAKLLGPITIGDGAVIGASAVVLDDVPAGTTVVGIPAAPVQRRPPSSR